MSYSWIVLWVVCFAFCMVLERRKLVNVGHARGWSNVILLVLAALAVAPALLMQIFADWLMSRLVETEKL